MQTILQAKAREKLFDIQRKPLPLEPSSLLREANRRRAFLSVGNLSELYDSVDGYGQPFLPVMMHLYLEWEFQHKLWDVLFIYVYIFVWTVQV